LKTAAVQHSKSQNLHKSGSQHVTCAQHNTECRHSFFYKLQQPIKAPPSIPPLHRLG
jgi:hypothetical protein